MTEPVLLTAPALRAPGQADLRGLGRSLCAGLVTLSLVLAPIARSQAAPAQASTAEGPAAPAGETASATASEIPSESQIRDAIEAGDLSSARDLALARSEAEPSADNFALEAEVWLALGDYERGKQALDRAIAALPATASDDKAALEALRDEVEAASRGTRADEPESTHREQLDRERAERLAALAPKPAPVEEPVDEPPAREPIVKKWYFWVTLGAIVATAGAIVGVAVASSLDGSDSDAPARAFGGSGPSPGGLTIRF